MFKYPKFSFRNARMVYQEKSVAKPAVEAPKTPETKKTNAKEIFEAARDAAIAKALETDAKETDMYAAAKTTIEKDESATEETKKAALTQLKEKDAKFEATKTYIIDRTAANKLLDETGKLTKTDMEAAIDKLPDLDASKQKLSSSTIDDKSKPELVKKIDDEIKKIEAEATANYRIKIERAKSLVGLNADKFTRVDFFEAVTLISTIETYRLKKFRGAAEAEKPALDKESSATINSLFAKVKTQKETLSEDDKKTFEIDHKANFALLEKAHQNFDASLAPGADKGWKAGAEQYLAMATAQGKAIEAKNSIPTDSNWRVAKPEDLTDEKGWGGKYATIRTTYLAAFESMKKGESHLSNGKDNDSILGTKDFEDARKGFLEVRDVAKAEIAKKEAEDKAKESDVTKEKSVAETAQKAANKYWADNIEGKSDILKKYAEKKKEKSDYKIADDLMKRNDPAPTKAEYTTAASQFDAAQKIYEKAVADYELMATNGEAALKNIIKIIEDSNDTKKQRDAIKELGYSGTLNDIAEGFKDYLNNPLNYKEDEDLAKVYKSLAFQGSFKFGVNSYRVKASYPDTNSTEPSVVIIIDGNKEQLPIETREKYLPEKTKKIIAEQLIRAQKDVDGKTLSATDQSDTIRAWIDDTLRRLSPAEIAELNGFQLKVPTKTNNLVRILTIAPGGYPISIVKTNDQVTGIEEATKLKDAPVPEKAKA